MNLDYEKLALETRYAFTIARGTQKKLVNFVVSLTCEGITGFGEAAPRTYYNENEETVVAALGRLKGKLEGEPESLIDDLHSGELRGVLENDASVRAAVDMALWDILGKREGIPCYELLSLNRDDTPQTSFTIGFDKPDNIRVKLAEAEPYTILKLKMGIPGDMEFLDEIVQRTGKTIRVDANEGWNLSTALLIIEQLKQRGVEFVEQPLSHHRREDLKTLKAESPLPIILDESIVDPGDVDRCSDLGHGINIKLMKCGGITPALDMMKRARTVGLKIMLGCMLESSLSITAAAHLSPQADYADLDGNLLLADDPFTGVQVERGKLVLPRGPGLGVERRLRRS